MNVQVPYSEEGDRILFEENAVLIILVLIIIVTSPLSNANVREKSTGVGDHEHSHWRGYQHAYNSRAI